MSAIEALAAAKAAGVILTLHGDGVVLETKTPPLPADVVDLLKAAKPDLMRILECREAARASIASAPPEDCGYVRPITGIRRWTVYDDFTGLSKDHVALLRGTPVSRWDLAMHGLRRFVADGWGDQAALLGWTKEEFYRVPRLWSQIHLTGAALMIGGQRVIALTEASIVIRAQTGSQLKHRRIGREHIA
jgi:hypothetical protein